MTHFPPPHLPHLEAKYYRRGKKIPKGFYRIVAKGLVIDTEGKIFIIREKRFADKKSEFYRKDSGKYDLPGGGVNWGEDFRSGLVREISEELALEKDAFTVASEPLYMHISELDDRYFEDEEKDDFYPVCIAYYPVKFYSFEKIYREPVVEFGWVDIAHFGEANLWSHIESLKDIFHLEDFPKEYLSSTH